jgi:hypothetical protein
MQPRPIETEVVIHERDELLVDLTLQSHRATWIYYSACYIAATGVATCIFMWLIFTSKSERSDTWKRVCVAIVKQQSKSFDHLE